MNIKNLSIGWVVQVVSSEYHLNPGYNVVRKIAYTDYDDIGTDFFNEYGGLPIIYPIVDFRNESETMFLSNGEYVIIPCSSIVNYLNAFNICVTGKSSFFKKRRIKNLVFENGCAVNEPLFLGRTVNLDKYTQEVKKLQDYKSVYRTNLPTLDEFRYLDEINNSYQKQYKKA